MVEPAEHFRYWAGAFQFRGVVRRISAFSDSGKQTTKTIDVPDKDVTDLALVLETGFSIKGQVCLIQMIPMNLPQFSVGLILEAERSFNLMSLKPANVRSGNYNVYAFLPAGHIYSPCALADPMRCGPAADPERFARRCPCR